MLLNVNIKKNWILSKVNRTAAHIKAHLNVLKSKSIDRREEEAVKFLVKKSLKYIQKYELKNDTEIIDQFKSKFFETMSKEQFNKLFTSSKELINKKESNKIGKNQQHNFK